MGLEIPCQGRELPEMITLLIRCGSLECEASPPFCALVQYSLVLGVLHL